MSVSAPAIPRPRLISQPALWVALAAAAGGLRLWAGPPADNLLGLPALLENGFTLALLAAVLFLAAGLGRKYLALLTRGGLSGLERAVIGMSLGLGLLAYAVLGLGLAGLLHPWSIWFLLVGAAWGVRRDLGHIAARLPERLKGLVRDWRGLLLTEKIVALVAGLVLLLALVQALVPPVEYDALMYHLHAPALYLQAGRLLFLPEVWQANGPSTPAMLFTLGLAFGSDTFAKCIHLASAVLLALAMFGLARRLSGRRTAWMSAAVLLGVPAYAFWAGQALTDITWALFQFLSIYAFLLWLESGSRRTLVLSGALMGLALGSKYLALAGLGILGLWALGQARRIGWRPALSAAILFGASAAVVAAPWYLKNWLWSGNPVYPFYFGGPGWDQARLNFLMTYLRSFGAGNRVLDYLLLPVNLYSHYIWFATNAGIELLGLLFPLALLYPWSARTRLLDSLAGITALHFAAWTVGSQQVRFLLPIFPALSLLAAFVLSSLAGRIPWAAARRVLLRTLLGSTLLFTILYNGYITYRYGFLGSVLGTETRPSFLERMVSDYPPMQFIQNSLPTQAHVLLMWDGRGYYCDTRCVPDAEQARWTRLASGPAPDARQVAGELRRAGITHLFYSALDAQFFQAHDPAGLHTRAIRFFQEQFRPTCTRPVYEYPGGAIYELICP